MVGFFSLAGAAMDRVHEAFLKIMGRNFGTLDGDPITLKNIIERINDPATDPESEHRRLLRLWDLGNQFLVEAVSETGGSQHPFRGDVKGVTPNSIQFETAGNVFVTLKRIFTTEGCDMTRPALQLTIDFNRESESCAHGIFESAMDYRDVVRVVASGGVPDEYRTPEPTQA